MFNAFLDGLSRVLDIGGTKRIKHKEYITKIRARIEATKQRIKKEYRG